MRQILCFGDSNTYGLIPGTGERYGWNVRWTSILEERFREKGYRILEEGLCGRTTVFDDPLREGRRGTEILPILLESHNPIDIIVLMLGTNDCKTVFAVSGTVIGKGIEKLLEQIREKSWESKVVLVSPILLGEGVWEEGYDREFDRCSVETARSLPKIYERIAAEQGIYYLAASEYARPCEADREHMDTEGHRRFAEALGALLEQITGSSIA